MNNMAEQEHVQSLHDLPTEAKLLLTKYDCSGLIWILNICNYTTSIFLKNQKDMKFMKDEFSYRI